MRNHQDPDYPDVKLWQTWVLCQELEKLVLPRNLPLVLCGDFNSLADSSVYELLSQQGVEQGEDVFGPSGDPTGLLPAPHQVAHRLPLLSAYGATCGEPKYTNYTGSFVGVLDYIFFTRTHLRCVACMDVDEESLLREYTALPSPKYPSDHIALATTLEFLDP
jgi:CCR4-NOT transcription complex subunit 6